MLFGLFKTSADKLANNYLAACAAEKRAIKDKEKSLAALRAYVAETDAGKVGDLYAYEKHEKPRLNADETVTLAFEDDLMKFNVREYFVQKLDVCALRDAITEGKDKNLLRIVKKHNIEVLQQLKVHFKRNP